MALWGNRADVFRAGTVSFKFAGINTYYADGQLVERCPGTNITDATSTPPNSGQVVFEVIGSATSFGHGIGATNGTPGYAATGDVIKFGDIIGGTYYGSGVIVGIASTGLCYIGSTAAMATGINDATLTAIDYTIAQQPTWGSYTEAWSQQCESDAETSEAGFVGLAYSVSIPRTTGVGGVGGASTTHFPLDAAYTSRDPDAGTPLVRASDTLSTSVSTGGYGDVTTLTGGTGSAFIDVWTSALLQTTNVAVVGVTTVAITTASIQLGDTLSGPNTSVVVNRIGLGTVVLGHTIGLGLTAGNIVSIARTVSNVATGSASVIAIGSTDNSLRVTRSSGADSVYIVGVATEGVDDAEGTEYETSAGWVGVTTYMDGEGNLRVKSIPLVALSGIQTGNNPVWGTVPRSS